MWTSTSLLIAAAAIGAVHAQSSFSGDMTSYTLSSTMSGNCNFMAAPAGASNNYAALNAVQWDSTKNCGRCAEVSCADSRCADTSKTEIVYIVDQCPECKSGDLDVSPSVFKSLTGSDPSRYTIKWKFVDCPVTGNLKYCLKSGSNPYFTAIQPANSAAGIKSVTINSQATSMVASAYYYLLEGNNIDLSAVKVSVTSTSGQVVTDTVSLTAGSCTTGKSQFTSSSSPVSPAVTPAPAPTTKTPAATKTPTTPATTTKTPSTPATTTKTPATTTKTPATTTKTPSTPATKAPSTPATKTPSTPTTKTPSTPATTTKTPSSGAVDSDADDTEAPSTAPDDDAETPATTPAPKTKKPKKTKKPSKDASDKAAGEASTAPSTSTKTKKPTSCRRLAE